MQAHVSNAHQSMTPPNHCRPAMPFPSPLQSSTTRSSPTGAANVYLSSLQTPEARQQQSFRIREGGSSSTKEHSNHKHDTLSESVYQMLPCSSSPLASASAPSALRLALCSLFKAAADASCLLIEKSWGGE
jgi:hypothetical protein